MRKFIVVFVYYAHFVPSSALYTESSSSWTTPIRKSCNIFTIDRMSMSIYLLFITSLTVFLLFSELVSRVCVCVCFYFSIITICCLISIWVNCGEKQQQNLLFHRQNNCHETEKQNHCKRKSMASTNEMNLKVSWST